MAVLGVMGFVFLALLVGAVGMSQSQQTQSVSGSSTPTTSTPVANTTNSTNTSSYIGYTYLNDFYYAPENSTRYPSCTLVGDEGFPVSTMAGKCFSLQLIRQCDIRLALITGRPCFPFRLRLPGGFGVSPCRNNAIRARWLVRKRYSSGS